MRIPSRLIGGVVVATLLTQLTARGSILYPDRRGQIDARSIRPLRRWMPLVCCSTSSLG